MDTIKFYNTLMHNNMEVRVFEMYKGIPRKGIREDGNVVRYYQTKEPEILNCNITNKGYKFVLYKEDTPDRPIRRVLVHRLVASAFIPNPEGKVSIDHINENKKDNRICNLRWCTAKENTTYYHDVKKSREYLILKNMFEAIKKEKNELKKECNILQAEWEKLQKEYEKLYRIKTQIENKLKATTLLTTYEQKNLASVGNTIYINGVKYDSIRAGARAIVQEMPYKNVETIRKELQKVSTGRRSEGMMYGKFNISLTE
jgi:hypothetical protein